MANGGPRPTLSRRGGQRLSRPRSCRAWTSWPCPGSGRAPSPGPATPRWLPPVQASRAAASSCTAAAANPSWPRLGPPPGRPPIPPRCPASPLAGPARAVPDTPHPVSAGSRRGPRAPSARAVGLSALGQPSSGPRGAPVPTGRPVSTDTRVPRVCVPASCSEPGGRSSCGLPAAGAVHSALTLSRGGGVGAWGGCVWLPHTPRQRPRAAYGLRTRMGGGTVLWPLVLVSDPEWLDGSVHIAGLPCPGPVAAEKQLLPAFWARCGPGVLRDQLAGGRDGAGTVWWRAEDPGCTQARCPSHSFWLHVFAATMGPQSRVGEEGVPEGQAGKGGGCEG